MSSIIGKYSRALDPDDCECCQHHSEEMPEWKGNTSHHLRCANCEHGFDWRTSS